MEQEKQSRKGRVRSAARGTMRTVADLPTWFSVDYLKDSNRALHGLVKSTFARSDRASNEAFSQAMVRMGVTEADLGERLKQYRLYFLMLAGFGVLILFYALYVLFFGEFMPFVISLIVSSLAFIRALQYHFWGFQIKHRKLGCSLNEWRSGKIKVPPVKKVDAPK
jgi:intracellular multiplication protein IcmV